MRVVARWKEPAYRHEEDPAYLRSMATLTECAAACCGNERRRREILRRARELRARADSLPPVPDGTPPTI